MKLQKKLAAKIAKKSPKKIMLVPGREDEIKEALTKKDIRSLIKNKAIVVKSDKGISRARAKKISRQKSKGRRKGHGTRKGKANARLPEKRRWINKIRLQRLFLKNIKDKLDPKIFKELYKKAKGGFFRSKRHIKLYVNEHNLIKKK